MTVNVTSQPDPTFHKWVGLALAGAVSVLVIFVMNPWQIFIANTPTGGDMGAHVLVPAYLRDTLLPQLRISGWSNDWFAGFPILYFYFPLPALTIVLFDLFVPYGVAFKLVTVLGLTAMPFGSYFLARGIGAPRLMAAVAGVAGGAFVFMESYAIYGGNIKSTLAGEYSYSWSMAFGLFYLGAAIRDSRSAERRFSPLAAVSLAGMALSHIIPAIVIGIASLPLLFSPGRRRVIAGWVLGIALAAFWVIPLFATIGFTTDMNFSPLRGFASQTGGPFPTELLPLLPLALIGVGVAWWKRMPVYVLLLATLLPIIGFPFLSGKLWNGRLLPYWFFGVFFFAGLAVGAGAMWVAHRLPPARLAFAGVATVASLAFVAPPLFGLQQSAGWAEWNYSGYESKDPWLEYESLMARVDALPPGRVMWEANSDMNKYGTPMALMLLPYWTGEHPSMEGLLFESSLSTPFHFMNAAEMSQRPSNPIPGLPYSTFDLDRGLAHMQLFDVRYYVTWTEEATAAARAHPGFTELFGSAPWTVFELPPSSLVDIAGFVPAVYQASDEVGLIRRARLIFLEHEDMDDFFNGAVDWYGDVDTLDHWLVESGPDEWPRVGEGLAGLAETPPIAAAAGVVSNVVLEDHRVSFDTTAVGVPHLVKVSYFPNWQASGADGPFRAAPAFMVVVPTEESVELKFVRRWYENAGAMVSAAALVFLGGFWYARRRRSSA
jgi:hypothetical protein